jgi:hypothetical protein
LERETDMASNEGLGSCSYGNLDGLVQACTKFYHHVLEKSIDKRGVHQRREQVAEWAYRFHRDCGTLSTQVKKSIDHLHSDSCLVLMTAHQPNFFAYGGVLRKATLTHVLAEKLGEKLGLPVVDLFGLADQDFTDDRWVRSALLPDVERRNGTVELRADLPSKMMLNRVAKPSRKTLDGWREEVAAWLERNIALVERSLGSPRGRFEAKKAALLKNFQSFWSIVEDAYSHAATYSDLNAFTMSRIVNDVWGYNTLFARFSECQQVFKREFTMILSRFEDYSRYLKEAIRSSEISKGGVYEQEYKTIPFWHHCECGSKARLMAVRQGQDLTGSGVCIRCGKEYRLNFCLRGKLDISGILSKISARSLAVPLVFFKGLGVSCYVGGIGGKEYLEQARYLAEGLGMSFPPVIVWRPKDDYLGVGQLAALLTFRNLSGTLDVSRYTPFRKTLEQRLAEVRATIEALELQKRVLATRVELGKEELVKEKKALLAKQDKVRRKSGFALLSRQLKLLENIRTIRDLHACVIDYAVNVGLERTSEQWVAFLREADDLCSDVHLETVLEDALLPDKIEIGAR